LLFKKQPKKKTFPQSFFILWDTFGTPIFTQCHPFIWPGKNLSISNSFHIFFHNFLAFNFHTTSPFPRAIFLPSNTSFFPFGVFQTDSQHFFKHSFFSFSKIFTPIGDSTHFFSTTFPKGGPFNFPPVHSILIFLWAKNLGFPPQQFPFLGFHKFWDPNFFFTHKSNFPIFNFSL